MLAGFGLHVGHIKLFTCFLFVFLGSWNNYFFVNLFVYKHPRKPNQKNVSPISDSVALKGQHMILSYSSHRREAKAQLILCIYASSSEPCTAYNHKGGTKIERSCIYVGFLYSV